MASVQYANLSKISELSKSRSEPKTQESLRKEYLSLYESSPYETNQIFTKNYEKPLGDPATFSPLGVAGPKSMLPNGDYTLGCVGDAIYHDGLPEGLDFSPSEDLFQRKPAKDADKFELLNAALRNSHHKISVEHWKESYPVLSRATVLPSKDFGLYRYSQINFGRDSVATFVDRLANPVGPSEAGGFLNEVVDIKLAAGADVNFVSLYGGSAQVAANYRIYMAMGSRLKFVSWAGGIPYLRSRIYVQLAEESGDAGVFCGNFAKDRARHDMLATVEHTGMRTVGLAVQNGVVRSGSRLILKGMMIIRNPARGSDSHLKQHALLLTPDSFANAIPGLEIETNDLKAKHAASVSQPDDEQLFYLTSRGLSREEAITTVAFGQLGPVIMNIRDEGLRDAVSEEITDSLMG